MWKNSAHSPEWVVYRTWKRGRSLISLATALQGASRPDFPSLSRRTASVARRIPILTSGGGRSRSFRAPYKYEKGRRAFPLALSQGWPGRLGARHMRAHLYDEWGCHFRCEETATPSGQYEPSYFTRRRTRRWSRDTVLLFAASPSPWSI